MRRIPVQSILTACLVNFVWTSILPHNQTVDRAVLDEVNDGSGTRENLLNSFHSIAKRDTQKSDIYREILEHDVVKERQAFDTMKEELLTARDIRKAYKKATLYTKDTVTMDKRDTNNKHSNDEFIGTTILNSFEARAHLYNMKKPHAIDPNVDLQIRPYSSEEVDKLQKHGLLKKHFMCAMRTLTEQMRLNNILGFICAGALIRWANKAEYNVAQEERPGEDCATTWTSYMRLSTRPTAQKLRGVGNAQPLLKESQYKSMAQAQCRSYPVFSKHVREEPMTVLVLSQMRNGTNKTIVEMLEEEQPKFLLSADEMDLVNIYTIASGSPPFPYLTFKKQNRIFAIPQLRSSDDKIVCASKFCR